MSKSYVPCSNLKTAGFVVAIVEVLLCALAVYGLFRNFHLFGASYFIWFLLGIISVIIIIIAIALFIYAIKSENSRWLIPHLSAQIFLVIFLILVAFIVAILLMFGAYRGIRNLLGVSNYYMSDDATYLLGIMIIVIYFLVAVLEIFFIYIVWRLYKHLCHYETIDNENRVNWQVVNDFPKDNKHGSAAMGDMYPYGDDRRNDGTNGQRYL
ncbi:hypothetical protein L3Y34_016387 [Caenorhabditis briggsae]|uniref:Uncharacterized protein n=1 Tax=Caenorhabditis briggsae TaxID=6238 RepID=A0AAE9DXB3_CAEBR|nr:hypothetical protein L3Y34_016387 [Caenorhabditis briggsae]